MLSSSKRILSSFFNKKYKQHLIEIGLDLSPSTSSVPICSRDSLLLCPNFSRARNKTSSRKAASSKRYISSFRIPYNVYFFSVLQRFLYCVFFRYSLTPRRAHNLRHFERALSFFLFFFLPFFAPTTSVVLEAASASLRIHSIEKPSFLKGLHFTSFPCPAHPR